MRRTRAAALALILLAPALAAQDPSDEALVRAELARFVSRPTRDREGPELRRIVELGAPALEALARVLSDPEVPAGSRAWAAFAIRQIGSPAGAPLLVRALADPSWRVRKNAAGGLGELGVRDGTVEPLADLLADPDENVARSARGALDRLLVPGDLSLLARGLDPAKPPFARQAATLLVGQMDLPAGVPVLSLALTDPDPETRQLAVFFLSRRLEPEVVEALGALSSDPSPIVRREAVRALAPAGAKCLGVLLSALGDADPVVRAEACAALGSVGRREAVGPLSALADPRAEPAGVALAAAEALFRLEGTSPIAVARSVLASGAELPLRARVYRLLGGVAELDSVEVLLGGLSDESRVVRPFAARSLRALVGEPFPFDPDLPPAARAEQAARIAEWWIGMRSAEAGPPELPLGPADPPASGRGFRTRRYEVISDLEPGFPESAALTLEEMSELFESFYGWEEPAYRSDEGLEEGIRVESDGVVRRIAFPDGRRVWFHEDGRRRVEFPWDEAVEVGTVPRVAPPLPTVVRVFRFRRDYRSYAEKFDPKWPFLLDAGGYFSHTRNEIVTFDKPGREHVYGTLVHEASHQVMRDHLAEGPIWLGEGLAEYFEHCLEGAEGGVAPGGIEERHLVLLRRVFEEDLATPLSVLVELPYFQFHNDAFGPEELTHYAQAWSLVHFLQHGDEGRYRLLLPRYFLLLREGGDPRFAWAHLLERHGLAGEALEEKWVSHVRRLAEVALAED